MTEIYLIRHAQAEGNVYRMMQGHWDGDVTDAGMEQIAALAERFKDEDIDAVYASDLHRTMLTASAITKYHPLTIIPEPRLREINVGPWETKFFGNVMHDEPELARQFMYDQDKWYKEGAETYKQVGDRVYPALEDIARRHEGQKVVAVSHGVSIRCFIARVSGMSLNDVENLPIVKNTSVTKLIWENGKFSIAYLNDYSHIIPLGDKAWGTTNDLRDVAMNPAEHRDYYVSCYEDAWRAAHNSTKGFGGSVYLESAISHYNADNSAVLCIYDDETPVGLIDMDTRRGAKEGCGWVSLIYLNPQYRSKGYGIQLLARCISKYSFMGRKKLMLHVADDNKPALAFYEKYGFKTVSAENTGTGKLYLMEYDLGGRHHVQ